MGKIFGSRSKKDNISNKGGLVGSEICIRDRGKIFGSRSKKDNISNKGGIT